VPPHFLAPILGGTPGEWRLVEARTGRTLADRLETAFDAATRRRGLLGRTTLPAGFALILAPCNAVHTFGMALSIDVVFAARDGKVVKVREMLPPYRLTAAWHGFATLEFPSGAVAAAGGLRPGDIVRLEPAPAPRVVSSHANGWTGPAEQR
jgi:uncharacterized membrane protein (UPF0127 family)